MAKHPSEPSSQEEVKIANGYSDGRPPRPQEVACSTAAMADPALHSPSNSAASASTSSGKGTGKGIRRGTHLHHRRRKSNKENRRTQSPTSYTSSSKTTPTPTTATTTTTTATPMASGVPPPPFGGEGPAPQPPPPFAVAAVQHEPPMAQPPPQGIYVPDHSSSSISISIKSNNSKSQDHNVPLVTLYSTSYCHGMPYHILVVLDPMTSTGAGAGAGAGPVATVNGNTERHHNKNKQYHKNRHGKKKKAEQQQHDSSAALGMIYTSGLSHCTGGSFPELVVWDVPVSRMDMVCHLLTFVVHDRLQKDHLVQGGDIIDSDGLVLRAQWITDTNTRMKLYKRFPWLKGLQQPPSRKWLAMVPHYRKDTHDQKQKKVTIPWGCRPSAPGKMTNESRDRIADTLLERVGGSGHNHGHLYNAYPPRVAPQGSSSSVSPDTPTVGPPASPHPHHGSGPSSPADGQLWWHLDNNRQNTSPANLQAVTLWEACCHPEWVIDWKRYLDHEQDIQCVQDYAIHFAWLFKPTHIHKNAKIVTDVDVERIRFCGVAATIVSNENVVDPRDGTSVATASADSVEANLEAPRGHGHDRPPFPDEHHHHHHSPPQTPVVAVAILNGGAPAFYPSPLPSPPMVVSPFAPQAMHTIVSPELMTLKQGPRDP